MQRIAIGVLNLRKSSINVIVFCFVAQYIDTRATVILSPYGKRYFGQDIVFREKLVKK